MIWAYIVAAALGLASGFFLNAYALAVASMAILMSGTIGTLVSGWSAGGAVLAALGAMLVFQSGYILSLSVLCRTRRDEAGQNQAEDRASLDDALLQTRVPGSSI
jgi:hypothetical protein